MMKLLLALLVFAGFAMAQPVTVTFSLQPLPVFEAAFLGRLPGVALYKVIACNGGPAPRQIAGGMVLQLFETKISSVDAGLVALTVDRARGSSKIGRIARVVEVLALGGTLLVGTGVIEATAKGVVTGLALTAGVADKIGRDYSSRGISGVTAMSRFLTPQQQMGLGALSCDSALVLGQYVKGFVPFQLVIQ